MSKARKKQIKISAGLMKMLANYQIKEIRN